MFKCEVCGKKFETSNGLGGHNNLPDHREWRKKHPFMCFCGRRFTTKHGRLVHQKMGCKSLVCAVCGRKFTTPTGRGVHEYKAHKNEPFPVLPVINPNRPILDKIERERKLQQKKMREATENLIDKVLPKKLKPHECYIVAFYEKDDDDCKTEWRDSLDEALKRCAELHEEGKEDIGLYFAVEKKIKIETKTTAWAVLDK